ncbi:MAG: extracellular solute-binding protein [Chloroflexi bacterium]|nr:extracellular solute-binding protein [Chloroflexota bacterium]
MKGIMGRLFIGSLILWIGASALAQETNALRFLCFNAGNECAVYEDLLARFSEENPEIGVVVDVVAEQEMTSTLLDLMEAGQAPDIARVAAPAAFREHYLDLRPLLTHTGSLSAGFQASFLDAMGADNDGTLPGFPDALGLVAPFINVSLFEQAGLAVPAEGASWDDWLVALEQVVAATDASFVLSVDNKDHRLVGPAMSLGAEYFDEDGRLTLPDVDGLGEFLQILHGLMEDGKTPADTLLGTGKSQEYFVRGETVMYICGSWKVEEVAAQVGDDFKWAIVANPAGPGGGTGVAQATALVALAGTEHPAAVANVFEYLMQADIYAEFSARTLTIPGHLAVAASPIEFDTDNEAIAAALNAFAREVPRLQDQAIALDLHPLAPVYYEASNMYLRGYFAGEYTLDKALAELRARLGGA